MTRPIRAFRFQSPDPEKSLLRYRNGVDGAEVSIPGFRDLADTRFGQSLIKAVRGAETPNDVANAADTWMHEAGRDTSVEHLAAVDGGGGLGAIGRGEAGRIVLPNYLVKAMNGGDVRYLTHNHPRNSGLSDAHIISDLTTSLGRRKAGQRDDALVTAMGSRGAVIAARPGPALASLKDEARVPAIAKLLAALYRVPYDHLLGRIHDKSIDPDVASDREQVRKYLPVIAAAFSD